MSNKAGKFFESLVAPIPRPYATRGRNAQARVRELLHALDEPQKDLPCVHIAGSKGKGSTALFVGAMLHEFGYSTGTFLSPHLESWTERFLIDGVPVDANELDATIDRIHGPLARLSAQHPELPPSFFDALTTCAFELFRNAGVDFGIIEAGLGGRLDATLVANTRVACITTIELEHTDKLGDTLREIAHHKAGIIKPAVPVVVGALPDEALDVILHEARLQDAPADVMGSAFSVEQVAGRLASELHFRHAQFSISAQINVPGDSAAHNAALAIQCVRRLLGEEADGHGPALARGLARAELPGRTEVLNESPLIVVDAAHTEASARSLAELLGRLGAQKTHLLLSMTAGKQPDTVLRRLLPVCARVTVTRADPSRSMPPEQLAQFIRSVSPDMRVDVNEDVSNAVDSAFHGLGKETCLCVAGSVYLVGAARPRLRRLLT